MNRKKVVVGIIVDGKEAFLLKNEKYKNLFTFPTLEVENWEVDGRETGIKELDRKMQEEFNVEIIDWAIFSNGTPAYYDSVDGIIHTAERCYLITKYKGTPTNLTKVNLDEIVNNPKNYAYVTYIWASSLKEFKDRQEEINKNG